MMTRKETAYAWGISAILTAFIIWAAVETTPRNEFLDPSPGLKPAPYNWVLNYTLTSLGEDRGTWSTNVQIYGSQADCLNVSSAINREQPKYRWQGFELKLAYAGCNRVKAMKPGPRAVANHALSQALQGLQKL
jgi:hypothetical protein